MINPCSLNFGTKRMKGSLMLKVSGTIPEGTDYIYVVKTVRKTFLSLQHFPIGPVVFGSYSICLN